MKKDLTHAALLIVDVQRDFCPGGALAVAGGDEIIPVINRIAPAFPIAAATKDWHPAGHVSFASSHPGKGLHDEINAGGIPQVLWADHCVQGSPGAEFHPDLDTKALNLVIHKGCSSGLDSYSTFFENDRRSPTGLEGFLRGLGVRRVYLCGLATDYCVFFSAMDAVRLGFETFVFTDAVRGVDVPEGNIKRTLGIMEEAGVGMVTS